VRHARINQQKQLVGLFDNRWKSGCLADCGFFNLDFLPQRCFTLHPKFADKSMFVQTQMRLEQHSFAGMFFLSFVDVFRISE